MAAAAILKSTLPALFVLFNQTCNFYWGILTIKGSLLSGALMLKRFLLEIGLVQTFTGQNLAVFWTADPLRVNLKVLNPQKARVSIGTRILSH